MDSERVKKLSDIRSSLGFSDFSQTDDLEEIDDPISAYFKERCGNTSKTYFKKHLESDANSSIGLIDVDNVSLFDEGEEFENKSLRLSEPLFDQSSRSSSLKKIKEDNDVSKVSLSGLESELDKQRALAQKALKRLSCKTEESQTEMSVVSPGKRQSKALADISSKLMNVKLSVGKSSEKEWLQPNFSPNTPRFFNDELSSFGGEDENLPNNEPKTTEKVKENEKRQSLYAQKVNMMMKELSEIASNSEMEFECQSKEEQINRFEEDEKKFRLENSGVLHNSQISQFSGTDGQEFSQWLTEASQLRTESGNKNLSIGQFFNLRSNRVSSLVGSVSDNNSVPSLEEHSEASTLTEPQLQYASKSEYSFPISEILPPEKPKIRRCVSTYDLKRAPEVPKSVRYSTDSCSSNSTIMIQDILAEMESGLSGTQIYEKLMKSYGRKENEGRQRKKSEKKPNFSKILENNETPKSSKEPKRKDMVKCKKDSVNESQKESKSPGNPKSAASVAKELREEKTVHDLKLKENFHSPKSVKNKKVRGNKLFFASTPKNQAVKSQKESLANGEGKVLIDDEEWEAPRVNSIQHLDLNRSEGSDENDKTVTGNSNSSSELNKKNNTVLTNDTLTIEDTIVAGDLTVLSHRIDEMKRDSVCIVRSAEPEEPVLLTVIQKLADLPKGSLDCSALTPLLRDQFPELLSSFPTPSKSSHVIVSPRSIKTQDAMVALPGSWVKFPSVWGVNEKICACTDLQKTILVPVVNVSQKWLLLSVDSLELVHPQGKKLVGVRRNNEWCVLDFVTVSFKETIIPPDNRQSLKIFFKSRVAVKLELRFTFTIKELMNGEVQSQNLRLIVNNIHPENYINVLPKDPINFGVIADQCYDQTIVQVTFDGVAELPLTVYIDEDEPVSGHFVLKPCSGPPRGKDWGDNIFRHVFHEGEKQVLEFRVCFIPNILLKEDSKTQDFKASLVLMLGNKPEGGGVLRKIPIKGSVGYAKFLCCPPAPLVFKTSERDQSETRFYSLKNVGSLPIALNLWLVNEDNETVEGEDTFVFPKSFYLSRNEESTINIIFSAKNGQNFIKRFLRLQVKPNGRINYEVELMGIVTSTECRPVSLTSGTSVSTKSTAKLESIPTKLLTTAQSLSWPAVSLDKEARQSFQIKNLTSPTVSVRISFERNLDAFKLVNENGEKVHKLRKVLKANCPTTLTVVFRPDVVGAHNTSLVFEISHSYHKEKILLNGIGGVPNLVMKNVKSDLNGCKILRLQPSRSSSQFENEIEFTNLGRIPAFIFIKLGVKDFSLSHDLTIKPSSIVIHPDSSATVQIAQKLKHNSLQQLLSDKEICKIATICVVTGDEPSRLRMRKLVDSEKVQSSERLQLFTIPFHNEKDMQLKNFKDSPGFENEFLKSLKVYEIAVVIERNADIFEPSILDETADEFLSFISDNTVITKSQRTPKAESHSEPPRSNFSNPLDINATLFSAESLKSIPSHKRVTKWLETLDCA